MRGYLPRKSMYVACFMIFTGMATSMIASAQSTEDVGEESEPTPSASVSAASHVPVHPPQLRPQLPTQDGMVRLPGGKFTMGTSDEKAPPNERPAHSATVPAFWIDRTEV